jgi:hypothetical protein
LFRETVPTVFLIVAEPKQKLCLFSQSNLRKGLASAEGLCKQALDHESTVRLGAPYRAVDAVSGHGISRVWVMTPASRCHDLTANGTVSRVS